MVGLTVVAFGTSAPELAVSVGSAITGEPEVALGNVVGSNIFNLTLVMGASVLVSSRGVGIDDVTLRLDYPVMVASTLVLVPIFWNGFIVKRWEGALLVVFYVLYVTFLVLEAAEHAMTGPVGWVGLVAAAAVMSGFAVVGVRGWRQQRR